MTGPNIRNGLNGNDKNIKSRERFLMVLYMRRCYMAFDIHQQVLDRDGMPLEKKARQYHDQLVQLFEQSPEGQALQQEGSDLGWASLMLEFGVDYLGVTPPKMSPNNLSEILFDLFPRKVSTSA